MLSFYFFNITPSWLLCYTTKLFLSDDLGLHIMQKEAGIAHQNGDVDA